MSAQVALNVTAAVPARKTLAEVVQVVGKPVSFGRHVQQDAVVTGGVAHHVARVPKEDTWVADAPLETRLLNAQFYEVVVRADMVRGCNYHNVLGFDLPNFGKPRVEGVHEDSWAKRAGVQSGDVLLTIAGEDVTRAEVARLRMARCFRSRGKKGKKAAAVAPAECRVRFLRCP